MIELIQFERELLIRENKLLKRENEMLLNKDSKLRIDVETKTKLPNEKLLHPTEVANIIPFLTLVMRIV